MSDPIKPEDTMDPVEFLELQMKLSMKEASSMCLTEAKRILMNQRLRLWYDSEFIQMSRYTCRICRKTVVETSDPEHAKVLLARHAMIHGADLLKMKRLKQH